MKRREFVKNISIATTGATLPLVNNFYIEPNPLFYAFARKALIYFGKAVLTEVASQGVKLVFDRLTGAEASKKEQELKTDGYYRTNDAVTYNHPKPLPSMPNDSYAAFSYAKKNGSGKEQNAQTLFLGKNNDRKEIAALLPETVVYALCYVAKNLKESPQFDSSNLSALLLPIKNTGEYEIQNESYCHVVFETAHGKLNFSGSIKRDSTSKPKTISGKFFFSPKIENVRETIVLENEPLDFIFT